jgi:hypothetical protein
MGFCTRNSHNLKNMFSLFTYILYLENATKAKMAFPNGKGTH